MKIVLDAGHGGAGLNGDPGAVGPCGAREKDVVLDIASMVHEQLPGSELTRVFDARVSLSKRAEIANDLKADLFISIHANAAEDGRAEGIETFHHASSEAGRKLATSIQMALTETFPEHLDRGVKTANFAVLVKTKMPAVLVETEFISGKWCQWLTRKETQKKYADAIVRGIKRYTGDDGPTYTVTVDGIQVGVYRHPDRAVRLALEQGFEDKIEVEKT